MLKCNLVSLVVKIDPGVKSLLVMLPCELHSSLDKSLTLLYFKRRDVKTTPVFGSL